MERQDLTARELARRLSGERSGRKFASTRRTIARWLSPEPSAVSPSPANRAAVAEALGVPLDTFAEPPDETELEVLRDLYHAWTKFICRQQKIA